MHTNITMLRSKETTKTLLTNAQSQKFCMLIYTFSTDEDTTFQIPKLDLFYSHLKVRTHGRVGAVPAGSL